MQRVRLPFGVVAVSAYLGHRFGLGGPLSLPNQRKWLSAAAASLPVPSGTVARRVTLGGRPALKVTVGATERTRAIVHLHGGAYTVGSPQTHKSLAAFLAEASGAAVYLPDYRLAPESPYPAALDDAVAATVEVASRHEVFALSGDSAGGGLAVATARRLIDSGAASPAALGLISPWVDPAAPASGKKRDLIVRDSWGLDCGRKYLAGGDPKSPGFAPMHGELSGLPPTLIHIGRTEVLYEQVSQFIGALRGAGVTVEATELPRLWHVGHAEAGLLAEAHDAVTELGEYLRDRLDEAPAAQA